MLAKERLLGIGGLVLSGVIEEMDEGQFSEYCTVLDLFVKSIPSYELEMRDALGLNDYGLLCKPLTHVANVLSMMRADSLAGDWRKLGGEFSAPKQDVLDAHFSHLMTATATLAEDIQAAISGPDNDEPREESVFAEQKKRILAVDDSAITLNSLKLILQDTEYKLTCVNSGDTAQRFLLNNSPDLIILDVEMPEMDGYELAKKIREQGQYAPIIFLTGNASEDYVFKAIQAGAADFIVKPVSRDTVLEKIRQYIG